MAQPDVSVPDYFEVFGTFKTVVNQTESRATERKAGHWTFMSYSGGKK